MAYPKNEAPKSWGNTKDKDPVRNADWVDSTGTLKGGRKSFPELDRPGVNDGLSGKL